MLLKVCNFAHGIVKFESRSDFWYPAEHFPTYRLFCKCDSSVCLLFSDIKCSMVYRTETFVTNHFSATKVVRNKVRSALGCIFLEIQDALTELRLFGSWQ